MRIALYLTLLLGVVIAAPTANADFEKGRAAYERGEFEQARRAFEALAARGDRGAIARLGALYEKGEYGETVDNAQTVLDKYPNSPVIAQAVYLKANAFDKMARSPVFPTFRNRNRQFRSNEGIVLV